MDASKKLAALEEIMDIDAGVITPETKLSDLAEWDSVSILSLIVMIDDEFGKIINGDDVKKLVTVSDAMAIMEA